MYVYIVYNGKNLLFKLVKNTFAHDYLLIKYPYNCLQTLTMYNMAYTQLFV